MAVFPFLITRRGAFKLAPGYLWFSVIGGRDTSTCLEIYRTECKEPRSVLAGKSSRLWSLGEHRMQFLDA